MPALTGGQHADQAIAAGLELLRVTRGEDGVAPIPVGIGVNTGVAYVGAVGTADHVEFTALGDVVNVTARLASAAGAGELLITPAAAERASISTRGLEHRQLDLRGKSSATEVIVLGDRPAVDPTAA